MNINELYEYLEKRIPKELSCEWDNDGKMVLPCGDKQVKRALVCLDITSEAVYFAEKCGFDVIVSHHPLIFHKLGQITDENNVSSKIIRLIKNDIAAFSFHTRLDALQGGVNDVLAERLELEDVSDLSDIGKIGNIKKPVDINSFALFVKDRLTCDSLTYVNGGKTVKKAAVVGGSGKDFLDIAVSMGADTFVTGEMPFNYQAEAMEKGINLVCAGHFFSEDPVCCVLEKMIKEADENITVEKFVSNCAKVL